MKFAVFCPIVVFTVLAILDTKFVEAVPIARTLADTDVAIVDYADPLSLAQSDVIIPEDGLEKQLYLGQLSANPDRSQGKKDKTLLTIIAIFVILGVVITISMVCYLMWKGAGKGETAQ